MKQKTTLMYVVAVGVIVFLAVMFATGKWTFNTAGENSYTTQTTTDNGAVVCAPGTLQTSAYFNMYNVLNTASEETFDVTAYLYGSDGSITTISDTTSPSATTLNCGQKYTLKVVSADGNGGDSAKIVGMRSGKATIIDGGKGIEFIASGASMTLNINGKQHGVLEFRVRDNDADGYLHGNHASENTTSLYESTGVLFYSKATNGTAIALGTNGKVDLTYDIEATATDVDFSDFGTYILVDASTSDYNEPTVTVAGQVLPNIKGSLDTKEATLWSSYEYVYFIDTPITSQKVKMNYVQSSVTSVNPSTDIGITFASKGAAKETLTQNIRYSGASDAASPAAIFTVQATTIKIS